MAIIEGTSNDKVWIGEYDFAVDGGAVGAITLRSKNGPIPNGSYVLGGALDILTGFTTGASGTGAIAVEGAGDIQAATIVSGAPYSTTGLKSITPARGSTTIKTTAQRSPTFTIATGALTAGKFRLVLEYI